MTTNVNKIRVFLIDDDSDESMLFQDALNELNLNYEFKFFQKGEKLLSHLDTELNDLPDVLFIDMYMPTMSGIDILTALNQKNLVKNFPIIFYSNSVSEKDQETILALGATTYVTKPPDFNQMKEILKGVIEQQILKL